MGKDFLSVWGGSLDLEKSTHGLGKNDAWIESKRRML